MIKKISTICISITSLFIFTAPVSAHVIVGPNQVGVGSTQVFDVSVPNEKTSPAIALKLLIPDGIQHVMPNAVAGWTVDTKKNGEIVTEIDWTGGLVPPDQRVDFYFQAQVPAKETTLQWKAYQTYQDGTIVAWDHAPSKDPTDDAAPPPYSQTKIVNDLTGSSVENNQSVSSDNKRDLASKVKWLTLLSEISIAISVFAIGLIVRKK